ncbi:hypothetical protein MASR1M36_01740 [Candidatus Cloacimonadaceae bacterium]
MASSRKLHLRKIALCVLVAIVVLLLTEVIFRPHVLLQSLAAGLYRWQKYPSSERIFSHNAKKDKGIATANLGKSLYRQNRFAEADSVYTQAGAKQTKDDVFYDLGNSQYRQQKYSAALKNFRKAILNSPQDMDAKANYELTLKKLQKQPPPPQENKQDEQEKRKREEIKNILNGLDNKESNDRKQNQNSYGPSDNQWW